MINVVTRQYRDIDKHAVAEVIYLSADKASAQAFFEKKQAEQPSELVVFHIYECPTDTDLSTLSRYPSFDSGRPLL